MRTIGVVTVARSDYGIYQPVLQAIQAHPGLQLRLIVSGAHLSPEFGMTVQQIEADGFTIGDRVEMLLSSDSPEGIAKSIGLGVIGFAQVYARHRPDILLVLGDRFDMYASALAALPFGLPVAHIHGGEVTHGAMDDALRHSLTKLSHLHFVATADSLRRVEQLGEEPWRISISGAPALDSIRLRPRLSLSDLESRFGVIGDPPPLLVTFHPVTLEFEEVESQTRALLDALDRAGLPVIFTQSNADTSGRQIGDLIGEFVARHPGARKIENAGLDGYFGLMSVTAAMVGNSSSGLIEAPSFDLPVVNVGNRQAGRVRGPNVIDVGNDADAILDGIRRATAPGFRASFRGTPNPYGDGHASRVIVDRLAEVALDARLRVKRFQDTNMIGVS